jgi:cell wall-associated NlpC family hydrolase
MAGAGSIALSLGLCLTAGQLVAVQPAIAATTTPIVAAAAAATAPKVTQTVNKRTISYGSTVQVTAKVVNSKTGKVVTTGLVRLQAYRNGWKTWQTKGLTKSGTVTFTSKPLVTGSYRTVFLGGGGVASGIGNSTKVTVASTGAKVIAEARKHKGALYKFGAAGPKRFDCSGFTMYVYKKATGKKLPHKANSQQKYGKAVAKKNKRIGDLIVIRSGSYGYHVGIYAGNNTFWDSPRSGKRVSQRKIFNSNYVVRRLV